MRVPTSVALPRPGAVTVIVVTYHHAGFVGELLASIDAQTRPPAQVLLCDDASTDASADLLREWAARTSLPTTVLVNPTNRGLTATLNAALTLVSTPWYAYISGDDVMRPDRLAKQVEELGRHDASTALAYSDASVIDEEGRTVSCSFIGAHRPEAGIVDTYEHLLVHGNWIPAASALLSTHAVRQLGGYDEDLFFEDYDLWLRLARSFSFTHVAEPLVSFRDVPTSLGSTMFRDRNPDWMWARIRLRSKHLGYDHATDRVVAEQIRPLLIGLAADGESARRLAPYLRTVARVDRRPASVAYALAGSLGSTALLRFLARARSG